MDARELWERAIHDTFKWNKTAFIGHLELNSLIMQDDISRLSDSLRQARVGCDKIFDTLTRKQLSVNHTKCKYLIIGSKKHRKQALEELSQ